MRIAYIILLWIILTIVDMFFAIDNDLFWNSFFYIKDYIPMALILYKSSVLYLSSQDVKMLKVASCVFVVRCFLEIAYITKIVHINIVVSTCIYMTVLLIILIIIGYDRKNKR